jgi:hypothetical protein
VTHRQALKNTIRIEAMRGMASSFTHFARRAQTHTFYTEPIYAHNHPQTDRICPMPGFLAVMITTDNILIHEVDGLGILMSMSFPTIDWEEWKG